LPDLAKQFMRRLCGILDAENVEYDKAVLVEVIKKHFPDWRRIINEVQRYSATGKIDSGLLVNIQELSLKELVQFLKDKDYTNMRKWVAENMDGDISVLFRKIYDQASQYITKDTIPLVVLLVGKYQYQHAFVADAEINIVCFLTEVMMEGRFI
jgi:hypothetical protein